MDEEHSILPRSMAKPVKQPPKKKAARQPSTPVNFWVRFIQITLMLAISLSLFVGLLLALIIAYDMSYSQHIYPGVSIAGIDLSGLTAEDGAARLSQQITYPTQGLIGFKDGEKNWAAKPGELGVYLNAHDAVAKAMAWGRSGTPTERVVKQLQAWRYGVNFPIYFIYDEGAASAYINQIATKIDNPAQEASLKVQGTDVVIHPARSGRTLDIPKTLEKIRPMFNNLQSGWIPLVIYDTKPAILDVSKEAETARRIISAPLTITVPDARTGDPGPWIYSQTDLAQMLTIERTKDSQGDHYQVGIQIDRLRPVLQNAAQPLARTPRDARYIFNDQTRQLEVIQPAVTGRSLQLEKTIQVIKEKLRAGEHTVPVVFDTLTPRNTDNATAKDLGITELVSSYTSYFYGSDGGRIQNITTAAANFHGVLVSPGETFSMASLMGDVSLDNGYAEALIIFGDRTIKGVGGGVCQVSTTLFRTAFFGGFPIVERYPHAYRVSYYEYNQSAHTDTNLAGLDATVFVPLVDFKFKNDTNYWLLMETYVNPSARTLTWKFYSTSDGRKADWETSGLTAVVEPPPARYIENNELPPGKIKQVDWAVEGADITVKRKVVRNGQLYLEDQYFTHYLPWSDAYEYGPGTELPEEAAPN
jgi:vancomycin resistance protein YoaR